MQNPMTWIFPSRRLLVTCLQLLFLVQAESRFTCSIWGTCDGFWYYFMYMKLLISSWLLYIIWCVMYDVYKIMALDFIFFFVFIIHYQRRGLCASVIWCRHRRILTIRVCDRVTTDALLRLWCVLSAPVMWIFYIVWWLESTNSIAF